MKRVYVIVEGQTEEAFIKNVLSEIFLPQQIYLTAILLGKPGHQGGRTNYTRVKRDVIVQLKQDPTAYCSTMFDFYGLGEGFPGIPLPPNLTNIQKILHIEEAVKDDICQEIPDLRPDVRFLPYLQLHEYEGLLFSDPAGFATAIKRPNLAARFQTVRDEFATPEDINDNPDTAPSKRVLLIAPFYKKVIQGTLAALEVGITKMRDECPHFSDWLNRLGALADQ